MQHIKTVTMLLRISIASVFLYAAIAATIAPQNWLWYIPDFVSKMFNAQYLLWAFSAYEFVLSIWILSGWKTFFAASLASLTLLGIIFANISALDVVFRDFAIFFSALALAIGSYQKNTKKK